MLYYNALDLLIFGMVVCWEFVRLIGLMRASVDGWSIWKKQLRKTVLSCFSYWFRIFGRSATSFYVMVLMHPLWMSNLKLKCGCHNTKNGMRFNGIPQRNEFRNGITQILVG